MSITISPVKFSNISFRSLRNNNYPYDIKESSKSTNPFVIHKTKNTITKATERIEDFQNQASIIKSDAKKHYNEVTKLIEWGWESDYSDIIEDRNLKMCFETTLDDDFEKQLPYLMEEFDEKGHLARQTSIDPETLEPIEIKEYVDENKINIYRFDARNLSSVKINSDTAEKKAGVYITYPLSGDGYKLYKNANFYDNELKFKEACFKGKASDFEYYKKGIANYKNRIKKANIGYKNQSMPSVFDNQKQVFVNGKEKVIYNLGSRRQHTFERAVIKKQYLI